MLKLVQIDWIDSTRRPGWRDSGLSPPCMKCTSVGYLVSDDPESVTVSACHSVSEDTFLDAITIPKVAITRRRWLDKPAVVRRRKGKR